MTPLWILVNGITGQGGWSVLEDDHVVEYPLVPEPIRPGPVGIALGDHLVAADTAATGHNGCRSYIWANNQVQYVFKAGGLKAYEMQDGWVFNNIVRFLS